MHTKAPFPYFGGKRRAASIIWEALGDPGGYVEPFAGSAAVLLNRPTFTGRRTETLNDNDGWLVNVWRSLQLSPYEVAQHAAGPVTEIDYHARLAWLQERRSPELVSWLEGDPEAHDPKAAAWWLYVAACGIGDPWGPGPWRVEDGHLRKLPHLGDSGRGVNRGLPHLGNSGKGVNRELPHLGDSGRGVNRKLPHLGDSGQGVNRELPHLGNSGQGAGLSYYFGALATRIARTRITCGSWTRVCKPSVTRAGTSGDGSRAIFLDPPYATSGDLYASTNTSDDHHTISEQVRDWCISTADPKHRIVLAGYDTEHDALLARGWCKIDGKAGSGSGYSTNADNGKRERLWLSPSCIAPQPEPENLTDDDLLS